MGSRNDGIRFVISSREVGDHLRAKAKWHEARISFYKGLRSTLEDAKRDGGYARVPEALAKYSNGRGGGGDLLENVDRFIQQHVSKGAYTSFLAEHVQPDATFEMSGYDAREFGFGVPFDQQEDKIFNQEM